MADYTTNLNLEKPTLDENYDINVFNSNADKIDAGVIMSDGTNSAVDRITFSDGSYFYRDDSRNTWFFVDTDGTTLELGREQWFPENKASGAIGNGVPTQFAGAQGDHTLSKVAVPSEINANPRLFMGLSTKTSANNDWTKISNFGVVHDVNTNGFAVGTILYFDSVNGGLTNVKPSAEYAQIEVGAVMVASTTVGAILVRVTFLQRASEVGFVPYGNLSSTNVQGAITQLADELSASSVTSHTQTESIKSVPIGTLEGTVNDFNQTGLSLVNSVVNGDFSDGTTGWISYASTLSVSSNVLSITGTGSAAGFYSTQSSARYFSVNNGDTWFFYSKFRIIDSNSPTIQIYHVATGDTDIITNITNAVQNQWYESGKIVLKSIDDTTTWYQWQVIYSDAATASGKVIEVDGNAGVFAINMTALGIESYTEAQMLDLVRQGYFEGLSNVENPSVTSVGKNLFDKSTITLNYRFSTNGSPQVTTNSFISDYIKVKGGVSYKTTSTIADSRTVCILYDSSKTYIGYLYANATITPTVDGYIRLGEYTTFIDSFQLELGSSATTYEPYKSSNLLLNTSLRRVPNGTKDEVHETDGTMFETKRVQEYVLQSGDIISVGNGTNVQFIYINKPTDYIGYNNTTDVSGFIIGTYKTRGGGYWDDIIYLNTISSMIHVTRFMLVVTLGTYANLAAAQTALAGTVIHYQLATPKTINLTEQGLVDSELISFENGTVYNSSDTFNGAISFKVPTNRSAQIDSLLESADYQTKQIANTYPVEKVDTLVETRSLKNWIINGGFDVWQRGTSQTSAGYGSDDRWLNYNYISTKTHSKQSFVVGQTDVPNNPTYFSRTVVSSVANADSLCRKQQHIEDVAKLAGKTFTFSFWAKADSNKNISIEFLQVFGTGTPVTGIGVQKFALTTSWQRFTKTVTLPSISGKTIGADNATYVYIWFDAGSSFNTRTDSLGNQSGTFDIANVSLVEGSVPVEWQTEAYADVLRQCQRYYLKISSTGTPILGFAHTTTNAVFTRGTLCSMRIAPTSLEALDIRVSDGNTTYAISSAIVWSANKESVGIYVTTSGLTVYRPYYLEFYTSNGYVAFNAEL